MKKWLLILSVPVALSGFYGCSKSSSSPSVNANVMFVNGCAPGLTTASIAAYDNGTAIPGASGVAFLTNSGYQGINAANSISLSYSLVGLNGLDTTVVSLSVDSNYSAFAGGSITSAPLVFVSDDLSVPASGYAKVRFVNLSPDNQALDCFIGTAKVDSGLAYKSCSPFIEVAAASGVKVELIEHAVEVNSAQLTNQTLSAGHIYTYMFTGESAITSGVSVLTLTLITNK